MTVVDQPQTARRRRRLPPAWVVVVCALIAAPSLADARGRRKPPKAKPAPAAPKPAPTAPAPAPDAAPDPLAAPTEVSAAPTGGKPKVFDFTGLDINGRLRTPQLLYFLDRASEELERASLERRSFIPEMVRSIDESRL